MHERQMPIKRARTMLGSQLGRDPTPEEIAAYLGQPTRYVTDALAARRTLQTISADAELSDVTGDSWYALLPDPDADTEATAMLRAEADELAGWMATLSPREREIIARYYGLAGGEAQTLEEIGQALGITRERVRQVKEVAMRKLQHQAGIEGVDTSARGMRRAG
jgi:RNA polymerase primary sigma factor